MEVKAINAITPNFGAKLKNNEETNNLLNTMDSSDLKKFKAALKKLDKHHDQDVLEIRNDEFNNKSHYYLVNTSNEDKQVSLYKGFFETVEHCIIRGLKEASEKGSEVYNTLFVDNKEKEKENKEREEVLSLMV